MAKTTELSPLTYSSICIGDQCENYLQALKCRAWTVSPTSVETMILSPFLSLLVFLSPFLSLLVLPGMPFCQPLTIPNK